MINDLRKIYDDWNKQKLKLEKIDCFIEITTPFVDIHHDYIHLFLTKESGGKFIISDDGHTVSELSILGIDIKNTKKRKKFFNTTLNVFGVSFDSDTEELFVTFDDINDYPRKQHNLIQCVSRVSDMLLTSRNTIASIFFEEVSNYFEDNDVFVTPDVGFIGRSGNQQTFDFVIPKAKKKNEKLIRAVNNPSGDNYQGVTFPFIDVADVRPNSDFFVIANDANIPIADKFSSSLKNYDIEVLVWSNRDMWVDQLKVI